MRVRIIAPKTESGHSTIRHIHHLTPSNSTQNRFIKETREEGKKEKKRHLLQQLEELKQERINKRDGLNELGF